MKSRYGISPNFLSLGDMALHGFDPTDGKKVVENMKADGSAPETINDVLKAETPGKFLSDYTGEMDPAGKIGDFKKVPASDREIITEFRNLDYGRKMTVQTHVIQDREIYLDDIANRVGSYDYDQMVAKRMLDDSVDQETAIERLAIEGKTRGTTIIRVSNDIGSNTGALAEKAVLNDLLQRTQPGGDLQKVLGVADGFYKSEPTENGIDFICVDIHGNYVIIEAKGTVTDKSINKGILKPGYGSRQMTDDWLKGAIPAMLNNKNDGKAYPLISQALADDLRKVVYKDGGETRTIVKELDVVQDGPLTYTPVSSTLTDITQENLGIMNVHLLKTRGVNTAG